MLFRCCLGGHSCYYSYTCKGSTSIPPSHSLEVARNAVQQPAQKGPPTIYNNHFINSNKTDILQCVNNVLADTFSGALQHMHSNTLPDDPNDHVL